MVNRWTEDEVRLLKELYAVKTNRELEQLLPRHPRSIQDKASDLKLRKREETKIRGLIEGIRLADRTWSESEISILRKHFSRVTMDRLLEILPNRSAKAIWHKGERLGLKRPTDGRFSRGHVRSKEAIAKQAKTISGENNVSKRPEVKIKISETHKRNIKEGKYNPLNWLRLNIRPTSPEVRLIEFIEKYGLPFRYTGNGAFNIGRLNPDFVATDGSKRVIEVFGRAFHDPTRTFKKEIKLEQTYDGRMQAMKAQGYDCLIIWDDELKEEAVLERINSFLGMSKARHS